MTVPTQTDDGVGVDLAAATTGASVIRGGLWFLASGLLPQAFTLILSVAAARFLGPDAMGRQSFIAFVSLSATTLFASGLATATMRSVAESLGARRPADARGIVSWTRRVQLAGAAGGLVVVLVPALAGAEPRLAWVLAATATTIGILQTVPNSVLFAAQRFREAAVVGLATGGVAVPAMIIVLALGGGISGMFAVEVVTVAANLLWTSVLSRRALAELAPAAPRRNAALRRSTTSYALYSTATSVLALVVWRRSEFFFLAHYSNDAELALYSIAFAATTALALISEKLAGVMSPAFATLHGAGAKERLRSGYTRTLRILLLISLPLVALSAGAGPVAIRVVYGNAYADAGAVLHVLLLVIPLLPLWSVGAALLVAVGEARPALIVGVAATAINIALAFALVPSMDAVGAAIANVGAQGAAAVLISLYARRWVGRLPRGTGRRATARVTVASAASGLATWFIAEGLDGVPGLVLGVATGSLVLIGLLLLLRPLAPDDARWLEGQVGERLGGRVGAAARRLSPATHDGLRLAVYSDAAIVGGAEQSLGNLLAHLDPEVEVAVLGTHEPTVRALAARRPGAEPCLLPPIRGKLDVASMARFARALRRLRPDILQVTLPTPWACRHAIAIGTLVPGVRVIAVEQLPTPAPDRWQRAIKRLTSRRLSGHVSVGDAAAREIERVVGLRAGAVGVIHNGVEPAGDVKRFASPGFRFGTLARLDPQKGIEDWLRALAQLPDAHAEIVGDGPLRAELEVCAAELGLGARVRFAGWSASGRDHLADWDALVLPSHFEGFPLSIVEAMLHGLPVVATDVGSVAEAVIDGETGLLVPPRDPDALAAAAHRLADDPAFAKRLGARGRELALERYTAAAMARAYEAMYTEVLR